MRRPVLPSHAHPDTLDGLRRRYQGWLGSVRPDDPKGRQVASSKNARRVGRGEGMYRATHEVWAALNQVLVHDPERVWVWSDLHLGHPNILRHASRPFGSVSQMDDHLLEMAYDRLGPDDWLMCLGDLSFHDTARTAAWVSACPGRKVLLLGNHDGDTRWVREGTDPRDLGFEGVADVWHTPLPTPWHDADGQAVHRLWWGHYPLWHDWVPEDTRFLHGHIHQHTIGGRLINASVEQQDYAPMRVVDRVRQSRILPVGASSHRMDTDPDDEA